MSKLVSRTRRLPGLIAPLLLGSASLLPLALALAPTAALARQGPAVFDIPAGPLDRALLTFAAQSHIQLLYDDSLVQGRSAPAVQGRLDPHTALQRLVTGSRIQIMRQRSGVFVLKPQALPVSLLAPVEAAGGDPETPLVAEATTVDAVVVTGSLIRGPGLTASPVVVIGREALDRSGRSSVADYLAALPQNYGGTGTPSTYLAATDRAGANAVASSGINLRGLGNGATLVLVNGRRLAGSGLKGDFADVSAVPGAAVERVEVLLDGASALYGSDAVGGVVNIILRRDFAGAETRYRQGWASQGGAAEWQASQTVGARWTGGGIIGAFEYSRREALANAKRPFTASDDLRPLGGTDHRLFYSHPGNVLTYDAASDSYVPGWAIPAGASGRPLTPGDFKSGAVNLQNTRGQSDILPRQARGALYVRVDQSLGDAVDVTADARFSRRRYGYRLPGSIALVSVDARNPYFVSPSGAASDLIAYDFTDDIGPIAASGTSTSWSASAGLEARLPGDWRGEAYGALAAEDGKWAAARYLNSAYLREALGTAPDNPATAFSTARDGYFNPYGANSATVRDFIGSGYYRTRNQGRVWSLNAKADGTLFALPGGAVKAAVGVQHRHEYFKTTANAKASSAVEGRSLEGPYERDIDAVFAEVRAPLVGADNAGPGLQRLELSLAGRIERYSDVGTTSDPKLGLVWSPAVGLTVRTSWGTSFRAPALSDVFEPQQAGPTFLQQGTASRLVLLRYGGNTELTPETATSWTAGVILEPPKIPGLRLSADFFDTRFKGQIAQPVSDDVYNALVNPDLAPFVRPIDPGKPEDLAALNALLVQSNALGLFPTNAYTAIVDMRYVNTGGLRVRGLDLSARYDVQRGEDRFALGADATWLLDYKRQVTPISPATERVDTAGQPVDLRLKGFADWSRGSLGARAAVNGVDSYHTLAGTRIGRWVTADLQLRWQGQAKAGWSRGLVASLNIQNVFDTDPPFHDAPQGVGFDPANADPIGRFISIDLVRRW